MIAVPAETPPTTPVAGLTVAMEAEPDTHEPPEPVVASVMVPPVHTDDGPLMVPDDAVVMTATV